jgi:hypothetical protein
MRHRTDKNHERHGSGSMFVVIFSRRAGSDHNQPGRRAQPLRAYYESFCFYDVSLGQNDGYG